MRYPNVYGIDMPTSSELVAHDRTVEEIRQVIGADALIYQDVDAMKMAVGKINPAVKGFYRLRALTRSTSPAISRRRKSRR